VEIPSPSHEQARNHPEQDDLINQFVLQTEIKN
jgi:hypothetical protein